jgi:hypothetical protein
MARFQPGQGGRPKGAKNRLTNDFLTALASDFSEHGIDVIKVVRVEEPATYLKVIASLMPRELDINATTQLQEIPDDVLEYLIENARKQLTGADAKLIECRAIGEPERREEAETDRE